MSYAHAFDGYYDVYVPTIPQPRIEGGFLAAIAGIAVLGAAVVLGTPVAVNAYNDYQATQAKVEAQRMEFEAKRSRWAIPLEWQLQRQTVKLDHMFPSKR